jgi:hypothetical protein
VSQSVPLYAVMLSVGIVGFISIVVWLAYTFQEVRRRIFEESGKLHQAFTALSVELAAATAAVQHLQLAIAPAAEEIKVNMPGIPKLLEAVARLGQAQLEMQQAARAAAANPFGGRTTGPIPPRDVTAANLEHEVTMMMRTEGCSREEAMLRLNPANSSSVWSGNSVFDGWQR